MKQKTMGIYLHIPFCQSKCPYCDFCSFPHPSAEDINAYTEELCNRMIKAAPTAAAYTIDTIYFGGGTPTLLSDRNAHRILHTLHHYYDIDADAEITLECNPATVNISSLGVWSALGVNRLSMGAQSAHAHELKSLGRLHTWADVCQTVEMARNVGIDNINVDFMMGIPHQTKESLTETLKKAMALRPNHISAYCLSLEEGTPYAKKGAEKLGLPKDDVVADWYMLASDIIREAGYEHYEISNFCLPGYASQHNLNTWHTGEYLGFGVAAHSHVGLSRFGQSRDMAAFLNGDDITQDFYTMTPKEAATEAVFLGLRLAEGISLHQIAQRFHVEIPHNLNERLSKYQSMGLVECLDDHIKLTEEGWLVSNIILADIWEVLEEIWG